MAVDIRPIQGVNQVRFKGPGTLKITQGENESLKIHAPSYVMADVRADVRDGRLELGYRARQVVRLSVYQEVISYDLVVRDLKHLAVSGAGKVVLPDLDVDALTVLLSGSGSVHLQHLTSDRLDVTLSGSGRVAVAGDIESQSLVLSGSGRLDAHSLVCDFARLLLSGSGDAHVSVSDELEVQISGSGTVTYAGFPDVIKRISGSGKLLRRRREKKTAKRGEENG